MSSSSKTSRLKLNVWAAGDSPMRADFNSDNALIDAAVQTIESNVASNTSDHAAIRSEFAAVDAAIRSEFTSGLADNADDHAAIRSEMSNLVSGSSDELLAYARETRRLVLNAYAMAAANETSFLQPNASESWLEDFTDITDIDLTNASTTARYLVNDPTDRSIIYFGAVSGHHPSLGDTFSRTSQNNIALPFTLTESCSIRGLLARPVYSASFSGDLNVTCTVYRATASGGTYTLGAQVFTATKERSTRIPSNSSFTDDYVNYVDTPFTLAAGTYCAVFYGTGIRANNYLDDSDDGNPRLAPYDKLLTLPGGDPSVALTVTSDYYPDAAVYWAPTASPYGYLNTKMLGFDRAMKSAAVYIYCDTNDLQCTCSVLNSSGAGSALTVDPDMRNAPCANGLYVTKLSGNLSSALTDVKLRFGLYSPSAGLIKRILLVAMRTEV